jgi:hypothetical protein
MSTTAAVCATNQGIFGDSTLVLADIFHCRSVGWYPLWSNFGRDYYLRMLQGTWVFMLKTTSIPDVLFAHWLEEATNPTWCSKEVMGTVPQVRSDLVKPNHHGCELFWYIQWTGWNAVSLQTQMVTSAEALLRRTLTRAHQLSTINCHVQYGCLHPHADVAKIHRENPSSKSILTLLTYCVLHTRQLCYIHKHSGRTIFTLYKFIMRVACNLLPNGTNLV